MIIRFGYCPPNPGPKAKPRCKWYRADEIEDAINEYDGRSSIWINTTGTYREISYNELLNLVK